MLSDSVTEMIASPATYVFASAVSVWEIEIKRSAGKLRAPEDVPGGISSARIDRLPITFEHAVAAGGLPLHHRDPFDRMLVAQAQIEGLTLATADQELARYEVSILDVTGG